MGGKQGNKAMALGTIRENIFLLNVQFVALIVIIQLIQGCCTCSYTFESEYANETVNINKHVKHHRGSSLPEEENGVKSNCGPEGCKYRVHVEPQGERLLKVEAEPLIEDDPLSKPAGAETPDSQRQLPRTLVDPIWEAKLMSIQYTPRPIPSTIMPTTPRPAETPDSQRQLARTHVGPLGWLDDGWWSGRWMEQQQLIQNTPRPIPSTIMPTTPRPTTSTTMPCQPPLTADQDRQNITQKLIGSLGTALQDVLGALLNGKNPKKKDQLEPKEENTTPS